MHNIPRPLSSRITASDMKGTEQITPLMAQERNKSEGYMSNMLTSEDLTSLEMRCASDAVCTLEDVLFAPIRVGHIAPGISIIHQWTSGLQGVIEYSCLWLSFELQQFSMPVCCYKNCPINLIRKRREREKRSWMEKRVWANANEAWFNERDVYEWVCECACYIWFNKRVGRG